MMIKSTVYRMICNVCGFIKETESPTEVLEICPNCGDHNSKRR